MTPEQNLQLTKCSDVAPLLVFYACDELDTSEREQISAHLQGCSPCSKALQEEVAIKAMIAFAPRPAEELDPTGSLLAQCRSELVETLDEMSVPHSRVHGLSFDWARRWMLLRPAWSAVALVVVGLVVGARFAAWIPWSGSSNDGVGQAMNVLAAPRITDEDLAKMSVAGIQFAPSADAAPGTLQVHVSTERPVIVSGNVNNTDVRRVLTYVIANGDRFAPGVRMDSLEALRERTHDEEVRVALLTAAHKDQNPAVRMKALETLWDSEQDERAQDAILYALSHDDNPGVRVEAVNLLVRSVESEPVGMEDMPAASMQSASAVSFDDESMQRVIHALRDLESRDPNRYVRSRSAAALRQIASRDLQ